jgi:hypothetical protein
MTNRGTTKNTNVGDLPATSNRARAAKGGATAGRQTAAYQHNQTDLEFIRAQAREIKGGALTGTTTPSARRTRNEVAVETLEIAHEGLND